MMMFKKKCPDCGSYSYSETGHCMWRCPTCKADIAHIKAEPAKEGDDIESKQGGRDT